MLDIRCYFHLAVFFLISYSGLIADELIIEKNFTGEVKVMNYIFMSEVLSDDVSANFIMYESEDWVPIVDSVLSGRLGLNYWFKIKIKNDSPNQYLQIKDGSIDYLDVYFVKDSVVVHQIFSGDQRPFDTREIQVHDFVYLLPQGSFECYFMLNNSVDFKSCLSISSVDFIIEGIQDSNLLWGAYLGILFVLIFYNFFIYLSTKEKAILWYVFYLVFLILSSSGLIGYSFQYFWHNKPHFNSYLPSITCMYLIFMILFVVSLLQIKKYDYKAFLILRGFIILCILTIVLNFMSFTQVWVIIQGSSVLLSVYLFFLVLKILFKGHGVAKYFLMTWSLHLVLIVLFVFQIKGLIHYNSFLINGLFFGSALESTLLSMVIGYKIKTLRLQKEAAENNRILKQEEQRKFLREQAHEIQSPIYFVSNYIGVLDRNFSYMDKLVLLYRDLRAGKTDMHLKEQEIQTLEDRIDIETVRRELFDGLNSVQLAMNQVENISKNFLTHSKAEEMVNINDCLNDTLSIIHIDLIDTISVDKELDDKPMIQGSKGQIEQVFMNVLKNAVESIQQKETLHHECIRIRTINTNNKVQVKISDTGTGMNAFVQKNLFVDCYTTKENGHGLGMAISKRIIEDHDGFIYFKSELGIGTEFMIEFPIK